MTGNNINNTTIQLIILTNKINQNTKSEKKIIGFKLINNLSKQFFLYSYFNLKNSLKKNGDERIVIQIILNVLKKTMIIVINLK